MIGWAGDRHIAGTPSVSYRHNFLIFLGLSPAHAKRLGEYICSLSMKSQRCNKTRHLYSRLQNAFQENACFCYYTLTKYLSEFNLKKKQEVNLTNGV